MKKDITIPYKHSYREKGTIHPKGHKNTDFILFNLCDNIILAQKKKKINTFIINIKKQGFTERNQTINPVIFQLAFCSVLNYASPFVMYSDTFLIYFSFSTCISSGAPADSPGISKLKSLLYPLSLSALIKSHQSIVPLE